MAAHAGPTVDRGWPNSREGIQTQRGLDMGRVLAWGNRFNVIGAASSQVMVQAR